MNEVNTQVKFTLADAQARITALEEQVNALLNPPKTESKEMSDTVAYEVTYGPDAALSHNAAKTKYGLTYGQIYSCRLGFTFKAVHAKAKAEGKSEWKKA